MQIQTGSVAVENGNNKVIASAGNDWSTVTVNSWFSVLGEGEILYVIGTVTSPNDSDSGRWEIELGGDYLGVSNPEASYMIHKDFTVNRHIPLLNPGDIQTAQLMSRFAQIVDALP